MKRVLIGSLALLAMMIAPATSFGRDRDRDDRGQDYDQQGYQSNYHYPVQDRYETRGYNNYQRNAYAKPRNGNYNYGRNGYGDWNRDRLERDAVYVGGGAAAGAVLGALIGHGRGAAVGALAGGVGGYLYKRHKDNTYNDYGYGRGY